jgi:hypothetical protein
MFSLWGYGSTDVLFDKANTIVPMPPSWILGILFYVHIPLDYGVIPVLLPADAPQPMTPKYIDQVHTSLRADAGIYMPSVLKELARNPTYLDHMNTCPGSDLAAHHLIAK